VLTFEWNEKNGEGLNVVQVFMKYLLHPTTTTIVCYTNACICFKTSAKVSVSFAVTLLKRFMDVLLSFRIFSML